MNPSKKASKLQHDPELQNAVASHASGRLGDAVRLYNRVLMRRPRDADALLGLGQVMLQTGHLEQAHSLFQRCITADGARAAAHLQMGILLRTIGRFEDALRSLEKAHWLDRSRAEPLFAMALIREQSNQNAEALKLLDQALQAEPNHGTSRVLRARIQARSEDQAVLASVKSELETLLNSDQPSAVRRMGWNVLGDILERTGEYGRAFEAYERSSQAAREGPTPPQSQRDAFLTEITEYTELLTPQRMRQWFDAKPADSHPSPAFLIGFPRSGTTMTERMLDAHPQIHAIPEYPTLENVVSKMREIAGGQTKSEPQIVAELTPEQILVLRDHYWKIVRGLVGQTDQSILILDKMPLSMTRLGLILRLFPDSRLIVALRDPRDVCLSCFVQRFLMTIEMSFFLNLQTTAQLYERVMGMWLAVRDHLPMKWLEVRYEDTVSEFEAQSRRIIEFLGLPWNSDVLSFHERAAESTIATPSYSAVSKPVHSAAAGRWKNFEIQLAPIRERLEPFIRSFGYGA